MTTAWTRRVVRLQLLLALLLPAVPAHAEGVRIWQGKDSAVTEGLIEVAAHPAAIFQAMTDYEHWPELFSDVQWAKVKGGGRDDALIQYKSRTFGKPQSYKFKNSANKLVHYDLVDGPSGVKLFWEVVIEPQGRAGVTRIRARLQVVLGGIYGWLVPDKKVRHYREKKLARDLADLVKRFGVPAPATAPAPR